MEVSKKESCFYSGISPGGPAKVMKVYINHKKITHVDELLHPILGKNQPFLQIVLVQNS